MKSRLKLQRSPLGPILHGRELPPHLGRAWGRHVFRLLNCLPSPYRFSDGLWLRDLPLSLAELRRAGFPEPLAAYDAEARRTGRRPYLNETRPA